MRVLIDTNVLLDYLVGREPFFDDSDEVLKLCADGKIQGYMSAHSVTNMFYVLRKDMTEDERREVLIKLCNIVNVENIDREKIVSALKRADFKDFEDCLQEECSVSIAADYIVTRDAKGFAQSRTPCLSAAELVQKMRQNCVEVEKEQSDQQ